MTDHFNAAPLEDRQSQAVANDGNNETTSPNSELYEDGARILKRAGLTLELSAGGNHAYHNIYHLMPPSAPLGIRYPRSFRCLLPLHTKADIELLEDVVTEMAPEVRRFWWPLVQPDPNRRRPLYQHALRLLNAEAAHRQLYSHEPFQRGITLNGTTGARAWIPPCDWFAPQVQSLTFADLFTIFPKAEMEMLLLIIGRAVVGRSHSTLVEGDLIRHTSRMAGLVVGEDAGLGKSTLFNELVMAMRRVGYRVETFGRIGSRFNLSAAATADLVYKDDMTLQTMRELLTSESTKIMVTGGDLKTEDKGVDAVTTPCHSVILGNTNIWDPRSEYDVDPGIAARIRLLSTLREGELMKQVPRGVSSGSPSLKPHDHLPWLAQKLEVEPSTLMLWACRLAADEFTTVINNSHHGFNALEQRVKDLGQRCRFIFHKDITSQLLTACWTVDLFRYYRFDCHIGLPEAPALKLDSIPLTTWLGGLEVIMQDSDLRPLRELLKEQWRRLGKPEHHPWAVISQVSPRSLLAAFKRCQKLVELNFCRNEQQLALQDVLKAVLGTVRLQDGFAVSSDVVWVNRAWQVCLTRRGDVFRWATELREELHQRQARDPQSWRLVVQLLGHTGYRTTDHKPRPDQLLGGSDPLDEDEDEDDFNDFLPTDDAEAPSNGHSYAMSGDVPPIDDLSTLSYNGDEHEPN